MLKQHLELVCAGALGLAAYASGAHANGRFPAANQLVFNPADPSHFVVRTTFGFVESTDDGATFRWICENVVSPGGVQDPPLAVTGDGSFVVAVPFEGVAVSHDHGCSWAYAPAPLAEQFAVDVTLDPRGPSTLLVLTSTGDSSVPAGSDPEFIDLLVETRDDARSWSVIGAPLPRDFIAAAFDVAPSDTDRIYVSGIAGVAQPSAAIERTDDRGETWQRYPLPLPAVPTGVFLSAIHPHDPDRLWVRVRFSAESSGATPTSLYASTDGAESWVEIADTPDSMLGFALSPDGETLAYGSLMAGVLSGPTTSNAFAPIATLANRCLTWTSSSLYACGTEPLDPFALGMTTTPALPFEPLYRLASTCPQECAETTAFTATCQAPWSDPQGIAEATQASGESCSVPWARASSSAGASAATNGGGLAGASSVSTGGSAGDGTGGQAWKPPGRDPSGGACAFAPAAPRGRFCPILVAACAALGIRRRNKRGDWLALLSRTTRNPQQMPPVRRGRIDATPCLFETNVAHHLGFARQRRRDRMQRIG
jgi:hypothetical protein